MQLVIEHSIRQNNPQPVKTTRNHPKPAKITHNHSKPPTTTQNHPQSNGLKFSYQRQKSICFSLSNFKVPRKQSSHLVEVFFFHNNTQKRSLTDVFQNRCSENYFKFHWKTPVLESLFNEVARIFRATTSVKRDSNTFVFL